MKGVEAHFRLLAGAEGLLIDMLPQQACIIGLQRQGMSSVALAVMS